MGEQGVTRGVPMGEARARLAELVDRTRRTREPVHLTRNGAPVAVLVDAGEWALLAELAERYEDLTAAQAADVARAEDDGTRITHAALLAELDADGIRVPFDVGTRLMIDMAGAGSRRPGERIGE